jgi:hypothetical protein
MTKKLIKGILAVSAGFVVVVVLSIGTDFILEKTGIFPAYPQPLKAGWMVLLATFYRSVYAVLGSFVAAKLAPDRPMRYALLLGIIGLGLNIIGVLLIWGPGSETEFSQVAQQTPAWYSVALVIFALPCAWLGGKLRTIRIQTKN